ncbi:AP-1 complex subunit gamma, putative [Plasmodium chabaudi chabaudi]|uniref:AP-1 complex subunit gamma, putative n=1 Tax=Plasmodium chabaudi chabaudi TaxID=31271 RepID=A0A4V0KBN8_PLACU|nr:AP-1 complex subunit gamma, putative [Plasmodium chabaudi chabaudi]VTZ70175.1 AP-1 complex subunit gamma, putative [Plasmodium chabaudi chabaudi]|eukprot:XP_016654523.1 AP-1 complex subunit gamma, putative [Plasmodium chabaudi chabaudi]
MSIKLRELIRNIRNCKTAAEERSVVAKECALIRTAFKEEDNIYRHRNVAKLLFINMLGYPTYFGQIECLKLIASNKFSFKRIGYLGLTILLDENTDILMLVTNSIKNDLRSSNQYINGLALCALGNIANSEMCCSLRQEILDLMNINNPYIKKKAAMCAIRILKKTNDIEELFIDKINNLLEDRNHSVISAGITLMISLIEKKAQFKNVLKVHTNKIVKILKSCIASGYSHGAEYDIYGINDPFLQVKILKLLKYLNSDVGSIINQSSKSYNATNNNSSNINLNNNTNIYDGKPINERNSSFIESNNSLIPGQESITDNSNSNMDGREKTYGDKNGSDNFYDMEEVNSVLAQVATNTDTMKNVGNAILYECVKTITYISTDPGLLVLAVNVLGKFLQNTDNNIRYVGLCTLQKLLKKDPKTLHIYRNTIIECLKDPDISIRKKALDVAFALITKDSLKIMIKELLNYLLIADMEIKSDIVSNICVSVNNYAPNMQYLFDTYIKIFCLAGNFIQDHIKDDFIYYLLQNSEYHSYVIFKIFFSIKENLDQYALVQVGVWCIGEFGDLLIKEKHIGPDEQVITVVHEDVFDLLEKIVKTYEDNKIKELHNINIKDPIHNILYNKNSGSSRSFGVLGCSINNSVSSKINGNNANICCNINENNHNDDNNNIIMQYVLMCLNKLTVRFPTHKNKIEKLINKYKQNKCVEIQQRACEFSTLMGAEWDNIRESILLPIPPYNKNANRKKHRKVDDADDSICSDGIAHMPQYGSNENNYIEANDPQYHNNDANIDLLDLDDVLGIQNDVPNTTVNTSSQKNINLNSTSDILTNNSNWSPTLNKNNRLEPASYNNKHGSIIENDSLNLNDISINSTTPVDISDYNINSVKAVNKKNEDILVDLFGNISIEEPKTDLHNIDISKEGTNSLNLLLDEIEPMEKSDVFDLKLIDTTPEEKICEIEPMKLYDKNDIEIKFFFKKESLDSEKTTINATYSNKSDTPISSFVFEAIVPNYVKMEILAASSSELLPFEQNKITQELKIINNLFKKKPVLMKVRLSYLKNNEKFQDFINVGNFPDVL